jgi:3-hydroxyacyl-[acyl-carrier-protein] dehydratase
MLKDDFYRIVTLDTSNPLVTGLLELNPGHAIFKGHFPGTPVVPGVCMMQIVKEITEIKAGKSLRLSTADLMKFLAVVDPMVNKELTLELSYNHTGDQVHVSASLSAGGKVCFKFKGTFVTA